MTDIKREIKFRGISTTTGEWVYGYFIKAKTGYCEIIYQDKLPTLHQFIKNNVVPDSVGQLIGLLDKNGVEIYEGDIIEHYRNDSDEESLSTNEWKVGCIVKWQDGISNHLPHKNDNPSTSNCNPQFIGELIDGQEDGSFDWSEFHNCEVVGNIYEHPHLLTPKP